MKILRTNRNLLIIALIAVVNALGYGIVIPILYSYSQRFGLSDFQIGLLFATFSVFQFISTPLIGRLSDKYGRRPLLIVSIAGTALSFIMMAFAPSAIFIFLARALDGATAGNITVASAVISDTTSVKDRTQGFGIIGAAFGVGFVLGPALSALTVGINPALPFIIAAVISIIAVVMTAMFLPETNKHIGQVKHGKVFDFSKLWHALFDPNVGITFLITLFHFFALFLFFYSFQPYMIKVLKLSVNQIAVLFTLFGLIGLVMQSFFVQRISNRFGIKKTFSGAFLIASASFLILFISGSIATFVLALVILSIANALVSPLINTILSQETDAKSQGSVLGLNASYMSLGQILGPVVGGVAATYAINLPFLAGSLMALVCFILSFQVLKPGIRKESTF